MALAGRLLADGVELAVIEAISDYRRIRCYLLESAGLNVQLVNPAHTRQLAERPKAGLGPVRQVTCAGQPFGTHQVTYNGRPLYLFYNDAYIPGLPYNNGMAGINGADAHTPWGVFNTIPPLP